MHVLVVDDDRTTRFLLKRALTKRFGCEVTEAGDGREALDALTSGRYQLAILDVQMPVTGGLQTLRTLRQSPTYASLPVVMLTGERDEEVVREILELGVLEYMTKPLNMTRLAERIRRVLRCLPRGASGVPASTALLGRALSDATAPVLIVEGRTPFRSFFVETIGTERPVIQAATGVGGLRDCVEARPAAVFVGTELGVLSEPLFIKKIRTTPSLQKLPLVAVADDEEEADGRIVMYDGTLIRTFVAEALCRQVRDLARHRPDPATGDVLALHPGLRATLILMAEQVFGTTLSSDVVLRDLPEPRRQDRVVASARGGHPGQDGITLRFACDVPSARRLAANLFGIDPRMVRDGDVESAAQKVLGLLSGRLQRTFAGTSLPVDFGEPVVARVAEPFPTCRAEAGAVLFFQPASGDTELWLEVNPSPAVM